MMMPGIVTLQQDTLTKNDLPEGVLTQEELIRIQNSLDLNGRTTLQTSQMSVINTIVNDNTKLSLFLLFGISVFALYVLLKSNKNK